VNISVLIIACLALAAYAVFSILYFVIRIRPKLLQGGAAAAAEPVSSSAACIVDTEASTKASIVSPSTVSPVLQRALDEWQYTFDAIIDPVLILDSKLRVVKGNQAAKQLLAVDGAIIEGKQCHQLFAGSETICPFCPIQSVRLENKPQGQEMNHRYLGRTFSVSCSPLYDDGRIVGFVHSAKDISHQRNLEKRLVHAHKLESIATLAGGIAHDFNNILGAILGNADLLLYRLPVNEKAGEAPIGPPLKLEEIAEHIQAIRRAGTRAKDLVAQILAFSRQSSNQRKDLLIAPVVKESCRLLRSTLPTTIDIRVAVPEGIGKIQADAGQIQQVVMHLCTNAAQALPNNVGVIEISLREIETGKAEQLRYHNLAPGRYVVLTIKDNGKGIEPETLERIFDPFFTTRDVGKGSGMGLAVLHGIVVAHEGVIDVTSEPGKGTVFTVFFPRLPDATGEEDPLEKTLPRGTETILFVDDEEDIVGMRTRMLSHMGYRVLPAISPEQALDYVTKSEERIDLVITDHTMPRMTGLQLAAKISATHPDLPIILCSGYSEAVTQEEAQRAGVRRFLEKPVDMRLLAIAIREILSNRVGGMP
jgi:two-component system, cell cycle sensor histidine kinase and response regulator CckA